MKGEPPVATIRYWSALKSTFALSALKKFAHKEFR